MAAAVALRRFIGDKTMTLLELFEKYRMLNRRMRAESTKRHYEIAINHLALALGKPDPTIADLTDDNLVLLEKHLDDGTRTAYTINGYTSCIKAMWRWAAKRRIVDQWPTVDRMPVPEPTRRAWNVDQVRALLAACEEMTAVRTFYGFYDGVPANTWWRLWHLVQWETGERTGAMLALTWEMVTDRGLSVPGHVRKCGKSAFYVLSPQTMQELDGFRHPERERIFPWTLHLCSFYNHYSRLLRLAGLPTDRKCKPHRMRKTHLTYWAIGGGDPTARAQHSSAGLTTKFYLDESLMIAPSPQDHLPNLSDGGDSDAQ